MREVINRFTDQAEGGWSRLSRPIQLGIIGAGVALLIAIIVAIVLAQRGEYVTLYSGLNEVDRVQLMSALNRDGIDYKIRDGEVQVKVEQIDDARRSSTLAQLSSGVGAFGTKTLSREGDRGYEILDRETLRLKSQEEFRTDVKRALEGELARTLSTFDGIQSAHVTLTIPNPEPFVREQKKATASVTLQLLPDNFISGEIDMLRVMKAMQRVVAYSVTGLAPEDVHVTDQSGVYDSEEMLSTELTAADRTSEVLEVKEKFEGYYREKLREALAPYTSDQREMVHIAGVEVDVDLVDKTVHREEYQPSLAEDGTGITRSKMTERESFEGEGSVPGGAPGVDSNLFPPEYESSQSSTGPSTYDKSREVINYEMDHITIEEKSTIKPIVKSAAVLLDLSLEKDMDAIKSIIAKTLGFSSEPGILNEKISVQLVRFPVKMIQEAVTEVPEPIWTELGRMVVIALTVIAVLMFLRSWLSKSSSETEIKEQVIQLGEEHLPKGVTVKDYVDQYLTERFSYMQKEHEEAYEDRQIKFEEGVRQEEVTVKREQEEQARVEAIESEKREQEEEALREENEMQRRKDVLEQVREFADREPDTAADLLRSWIAESDATAAATAESESAEVPPAADGVDQPATNA